MIMKLLRYSVLLFFISLFVFSCKDNDDELHPASSLEIKNFIWKAMNVFYLYKSDVPNLERTEAVIGSGAENFESFLNKFDTPEALYEALQAPQDRFSFMSSNYLELEKLFSGVSTSNGLEFGLNKYPDSSGNVYGFVKHILPDTDASRTALKRGDIFSTINGEQITEDNFRRLISQNSYTIGLANFDGTTVMPLDVTVSLTKREYMENPIFIEKIIEIADKKVGYLMYNSFIREYDTQLNAVFGNFKASGVTDLVLDLRYNGGGSVSNAINLASMISGVSKDNVFSTEEWNSRIQADFQKNNPGRLTNFFRERLGKTNIQINTLKLSKVYVLTTKRSASASELVINGLNPYMDVVQIGERTRGKYQASITLYDSPDFRRARARRNHFYAIQPLVLKSLNRDGFTDFDDGLVPDIAIEEDVTNAGVLGDPEEPLLKAALDLITSSKKTAGKKRNSRSTEEIGNNHMFQSNYERMYISL